MHKCARPPLNDSRPRTDRPRATVRGRSNASFPLVSACSVVRMIGKIRHRSCAGDGPRHRRGDQV